MGMMSGKKGYTYEYARPALTVPLALRLGRWALRDIVERELRSREVVETAQG